MDLKDKVAIITGGAVRIGRAMSLALAERGVKLCVHYGSSQVDANNLANEIQKSGGEIVTVQADFAGDAVAAAKTVIDDALDAFGRLDVLVNSAAIFEPGTLQTTTAESWDRHLSINLRVPFFLCQEFAVRRSSNKAGHIVNIVDWRAIRPKPGHLAYTISKSGLVTMTKCLAAELAPEIQVNAIAPGAILPPPDEDDAYLERLREQIPLRRTGSPDEIVHSLLYLLESDFVTGEILHVTGGEEL